MGERPAAWQLIEHDPAAYEQWYATARGRRADLAEPALLERLLAPFATARSALEIGCGTGHFTRWLGDRLSWVVGLDRASATLAEARRCRLRLSLIEGDAHELPIRDRAVDLSVFVVTLEFVEQPAMALAEAVRVARQGVLLVTLHRRSVGALSRRWGPDARRPVLGRARDFSLASLRVLASTAAGSRLRDLRWASALFPGGPAPVVRRIPCGDVTGIALEFAP